MDPQTRNDLQAFATHNWFPQSPDGQRHSPPQAVWAGAQDPSPADQHSAQALNTGFIDAELRGHGHLPPTVMTFTLSSQFALVGITPSARGVEDAKVGIITIDLPALFQTMSAGKGRESTIFPDLPPKRPRSTERPRRYYVPPPV